MSWLSLSTSPREGYRAEARRLQHRVSLCARWVSTESFLDPMAGWERSGGPCRDSCPGNATGLGWSGPPKMVCTLPAPHCACSNTHRAVKSSLHLKPLHPAWLWSCSVTFSPQRRGPAHPSAAVGMAGVARVLLFPGDS